MWRNLYQSLHLLYGGVNQRIRETEYLLVGDVEIYAWKTLGGDGAHDPSVHVDCAAPGEKRCETPATSETISRLNDDQPGFSGCTYLFFKTSERRDRDQTCKDSWQPFAWLVLICAELLSRTKVDWKRICNNNNINRDTTRHT